MPRLRDPYNVGEYWKDVYKWQLQGVGLFLNIILTILLFIAIVVLKCKNMI